LQAVSSNLSRTRKSLELRELVSPEVVRQRAAMIAAIELKDPDEADALACPHTDLFRERVNAYLGQSLARDIALGSPA
jgi:DNA-binding FadR family transcriptional regulator